jgi:hypothetical protein
MLGFACEVNPIGAISVLTQVNLSARQVKSLWTEQNSATGLMEIAQLGEKHSHRPCGSGELFVFWQPMSENQPTSVDFGICATCPLLG